MNKSFATFLIILLSIIVISITVGFVYLMKSNFSFNFNIGNSYSEKLIESKTFETTSDIYISSKNCDVTIEQSEDNNIVVELYSDEVEEYFINREDDKINVKLFNKNTMGFNLKTSRVLIKLPANYENKINIDAVVGDIHIDDFEFASAFVKNTVGDIKVKNINTAIIDNGTGDIKIENINDLSVVGKTGDIKVGNVNNIDAKVDTGDIKIQSINNKVNLTSGVGDVKIENAIIKEDSFINGKIGDIKIMNLTGAYVEAVTNIGDMKVDNVDRKLKIILKINNNTNDIKVNVE